MPSELYIGIMTGTSLDAIDVAICDFSGDRAGLISFHSAQWPPALRDIIMELATAEFVAMDILARSNFLLSRYYADAIRSALNEANLKPENIRAIGLHGQTIRHVPNPESISGLPATGATIQWGSGSALAAEIGIDVVNDFRSADVALGGQGAPLVPMFDCAFLRSTTTNRLVTNIGGISNVTWLKANGSENDVIAFDCGPGNMMLDSFTKKYFAEPYDKNGSHARKGTIDESTLDSMLAHPYFSLVPPKSTGRELFGDNFLSTIYRRVDSAALSKESALATLTELTARCISQSLDFVDNKGQNEIVLSGGGALNGYLVERIQVNAPRSTVLTSDDFGISSSAKEAIAFAFFAKAFSDGTLIHLPRTTGARSRTHLGSLSRAFKK